MAFIDPHRVADYQEELKQQRSYMREKKINDLIHDILNDSTALMEHIGDYATENDKWDEWDKLIQQVVGGKSIKLDKHKLAVKNLQHFAYTAVKEYAINYIDNQKHIS